MSCIFVLLVSSLNNGVALVTQKVRSFPLEHELGMESSASTTPASPWPPERTSRSCAKVIYTGMSEPSSDFLANRTWWDAVDAGPWDGSSWSGLVGGRVMGNVTFSSASTDVTSRFKAAERQFTHFTSQHVTVSLATNTDFDWMDDTRWATVLNNIKAVAAGARESGSFFSGVILDPETYGDENPWSYPIMANITANHGHGRISWDMYRSKVQQRGQSFMKALLDEWPSMRTVLWYWAYSGASFWGEDSPLHVNCNGLLVAFADGCVQAIDTQSYDGDRTPPVFIDGFEMTYNMHDWWSIRSAGLVSRNAYRMSAVPEAFNRTVRAGFGFCFDCGGGIAVWGSLGVYGFPDGRSAPTWQQAGRQKHQFWSDTDKLHRNIFPPGSFEDTLTNMLIEADPEAIIWLWSADEVEPFGKNCGPPWSNCNPHPNYGLHERYLKALAAARRNANCSNAQQPERERTLDANRGIDFQNPHAIAEETPRELQLIGGTKPCSCANASLCKPLNRTVTKEVFAFSAPSFSTAPSEPDGWHSFNFSTITTIGVWGDIDPELVCYAHQHGVRVVAGAGSGPVDWLDNSTARAAAVSFHVKTIADSGLDGISLDIEKQSTDATGMTLFVQELRKAMKADNAHLQLSFCLGSRPSVKGGYNVTALSESLDFILPMYVGITSCLAFIWS